MSKFNELTAMVTSGLSTARIILPLLGVAVLAVIVSFLLNETVVPEATRRREAILEGEVHRRQTREPTEYSNVSFLGEGGRVYLVRLYLVPEKRMHDVLITEFQGDAIARRIDARTARWDGRQWIFQDGVIRTFTGDKEQARPFERLALPDLPERPSDFEKEPQDPEQMGYGDLADYVRRLEQSGLRVEKYRVDLQLKLAFPFINLIVVVLGAALAARFRQANTALGFGISVSIAFLYFGLMRAGQQLGQSGNLPPVVAAWSANMLFGVVALGLLWQAQRR